MKNVQRINATKARNDFFNILKKAYLEKQIFLIEKGSIPMVYLIPTSSISERKSSQTKILTEAQKLRDSMNETSDSVLLLRRMRRYAK